MHVINRFCIVLYLQNLFTLENVGNDAECLLLLAECPIFVFIEIKEMNDRISLSNALRMLEKNCLFFSRVTIHCIVNY